MMGKRKPKVPDHAVAPRLNAVAGRVPVWTCGGCTGLIRWLSPRSNEAVHA